MVFFVLRCVFAVLAFGVLWKLWTAGMVCYRCQPPVSACLRWALGIPWHLREAQKRLCHDSGDETERPSASGGSVMARLGSAVRGGCVMRALLDRRHPMPLGIISDLRNPQHPKVHRPWVHTSTEFLDLMVQFEDLGFEEVMVPEHHVETDGYSPNPMPIFMPAQTPKAMERNAREGYGANQGAGWWTFEREDLAWWKHWHTEWQAALARHGSTAQAGLPARCLCMPYAMCRGGLAHDHRPHVGRSQGHAGVRLALWRKSRP